MTEFRIKYRFVYIAVWSAAAIVLSIAEGFIPMPPVIYGARIGLANIVVMVVLDLMSYPAALSVTVVKAVAAALLTGTASALPYSLAGGTAAWLVMSLFYRVSRGRLSFVGLSVMGAAAHSAAQIAVASLFINSTAVFMYLPFLLLLSAATGIFTGLCANAAIPFIAQYGYGRVK